MTKATELLYIDEIDEFITVGKRMQEECEPDLPFSELEARSNAMTCLNDLKRESLNCWVVRHQGKIVGFSAGRCGKYLFSESTIATMIFWYVLPEYRKTRAAFELLHNFENWARLNGAVRIEVGAAKTDTIEANNINKMFAKRNFTKYGELYYRNLKG